MVGSRDIIKRKQYACYRLVYDDKKCGAAQGIQPVNMGDLAKKNGLPDTLPTQSIIQPVSECCQHDYPPLRMYSIPSSTLFSNRSNGRGGGPPMTVPVFEKAPLWHGQKNRSSSSIQRTLQPRCVQTLDRTVKSCPFSVNT